MRVNHYTLYHLLPGGGGPGGPWWGPDGGGGPGGGGPGGPRWGGGGGTILKYFLNQKIKYLQFQDYET